MRTVFCSKLKKDLPGLESAPLPGDFGKKIYDNISQEAWDAWMIEQTKIINELKLKMFEPQAQETLRKQAEIFLFGE